MEKLAFWTIIFIWIATGGIAIYKDIPIPPPNVWSVASCFVFLYLFSMRKSPTERRAYK